MTGAAGKTGGLIVKKLVERSAQFEPRALVRSEKVRKAVSHDVFLGNMISAGQAMRRHVYLCEDSTSRDEDRLV